MKSKKFYKNKINNILLNKKNILHRKIYENSSNMWKNCQKLQKFLKIYRKNQKILFIFQKKKKKKKKKKKTIYLKAKSCKEINVFAIVFFSLNY